MFTRSQGVSVNVDSSPVSVADSCGDAATLPSISVTVTAAVSTASESLKTELDYDNLALLSSLSEKHLLPNILLRSCPVDAVPSCVLTQTTATLTPTTLGTVERQLPHLIELPETHSNQAGFVPPFVKPPQSGSTFISVDSKGLGGGVATVSQGITSASSATLAPLTTTTAPSLDFNAIGNSPATMASQTSTGRRTGGRRPYRDEKLTPEEEERRRMRRERNKLAAARCRKRRLDQTNMLQEETDGLEEKKSSLQKEIQSLQQLRDELEFLLATHKAVCQKNIKPFYPTPASPLHAVMLQDSHTELEIKEEPIEMEDLNSSSQSSSSSLPTSLSEDSFPPIVLLKEPPLKPQRPTSLAIASMQDSSLAHLNIPIETPSTALKGMGLNFESMMEGGTGLTPVTCVGTLPTGLTPLTTPVVTAPNQPNCSSQQRSSSSELSSPDSVPPKLVSL